jgi:predicted AlkP superfamily phosphohydrolase/phosphomutase
MGSIPWVHHGYLPVANQIDLFMHFLGASRDGLVARRVDLDTISSSVWQRLAVNRHQQDTFFGEIGPYAHTIDINIGSIMNMIGRAYIIIQNIYYVHSSNCMFHNNGWDETQTYDLRI